MPEYLIAKLKDTEIELLDAARIANESPRDFTRRLVELAQTLDFPEAADRTPVRLPFDEDVHEQLSQIKEHTGWSMTKILLAAALEAI